MNAKQSLASIVPPPRGAVRLRDLWPLVLFLIIYAAICIGLEASDTLLFTYRWAFWLLLTTVWVWWLWLVGASGLSRQRRLLALFTRLTLVGLLVMVISEPRAVRTSDTLSVVYTVDVSDSIGEGAADKAIEFVTRTVVDKPDKDEAGLIAFGRNAAVELPPRKSFPFEALNSQIHGDATDLEQALSLSAAMIPEESRGRIVLISDGTQTSGTIDGVLDQLASRGIAVDVLPIEYQYDREVWVERLDLPRFVKLGENYTASALVSSLKADKGRLVLRENTKVIWEQDVEFVAGKTRIEIPITVGEPGYYEYKATIETEEEADHLSENNDATNYLFVEGEGKTLLVYDGLGDERDWQSLALAIREAERSVRLLQAADFPRDPLSLLPYDCVIFVNVGQDAFDMVQLQALHDAIYNQGVGFLMVGGANSFGPGGYHRTLVEKALPVSMDITQRKILPKGALAIILHTCEFPEGNTWGKRITKQAIKVLSSQDEVGVLAYTGDGEGWVFELTPAGEYESLVPKINGVGIGDMPSFGPTMQQALDALAASDAAAKHVIVISDGDPDPPAPGIVKGFVDQKISCTMVAIFPHGGADISKMRTIASVTGGKYYFPSDPNQLPAIFIKEAKTLKRNMVQEKTIQPDVGFPSQVLNGIDALPPLHGYVLATPKADPRVENILVYHEHIAEEEETDPILSIWRYGLATTAAFTSDLSPNWGADWVNWSQYVAFVKQLLIRISRVNENTQLRMWTYMSGGDGVIMVEDFHEDEMFLDLQAKVAGPREQEQSIPLKQVGPRRYQATFPLWGTGQYQVMTVGQTGDRSDRAHGGFIVPYSPEYLRFRSNPILLDQIRERTGGSLLTAESTAKDIYNRRLPKQSSQPIFDWFLIALACLLPLDVAVRRVQLDWSTIRSWFWFDQPQQPSSTIGTLLERKHSLDRQLKRPTIRPRPTSAAAPSYLTETSQEREKPSGRKSTSPASEENEQTSTTSRLLELKKRREEET